MDTPDLRCVTQQREVDEAAGVWRWRERNLCGVTSLLASAFYGAAQVVEFLLLERDCQVNVLGRHYGYVTPLQSAGEQSSPEAVHLLLEMRSSDLRKFIV